MMSADASQSDQLLNLAGVAGFRAMVEAYGGTRFWIPKRLDGDAGRRLVQLVGPDAAAALANEFGGFHVTVPNLKAIPSERANVHRLLSHGLKAPEIALTLRVTEKTVRKHIATYRPGQAR